eukprot:TRINITY_DN13014_c0_g3_i1.p1 TRINITY_DN13014_c0_g3~~TRINITY_DN13014_c0_g3_i1.p1  ORF type:complete len:144 (-),score=30.45 TRINITY_DN13014_c0_g3_i1:223-654(-)
MQFNFSTVSVLFTLMVCFYGKQIRVLQDNEKEAQDSSTASDTKSTQHTKTVAKITYDEFGPVYEDDEPEESLPAAERRRRLDSSKPRKGTSHSNFRVLDESEDFDGISFTQQDIDLSDAVLGGDVLKKMEQIDKMANRREKLV